MTAPTWDPATFVQLTDYREVEEVLRRGRDFVLGGTKRESDEFVHGTLIAIDGPEHHVRRRQLLRMIGVRQPWGAEGKLLDELFAQALARLRAGEHERFELIGFCRDVLWRFTAVMVGLDGLDDEESVARFLALMVPVLHGLSVEYLPEEQREAVVRAARDASERIREEMFLPSVARRRELLAQAGEDERPADLITSLLAGGADEDLEPIFREMVELLAGSVNNPVSQVAWGLHDLQGWLAEHPEDRARLGERDFLNQAVKETLRLHRSSRPYLVRIAAADTVLESSGRELKAGTWVASWVGAANRDTTIFGPDADRYDPHRVPLAPKVPGFGVSFGHGPHICLGRPLVLWEQGSEEAQGLQTKILRWLLAAGVRPDPDGVRDEVGEPGGRRFDRYDVIMPATAVAAAAERLAQAAASGHPCAPVRDLIGRDDMAAAYAVQAQLNARRGAPAVGRKIGATSRAVQEQLGVDQPDFGVLFADMRFADCSTLPIERLLQPRVEAEIAFVLGDDLIDGPLDAGQCRRAVEFALAALEIVDSRIAGWDISFADTVADNASSGLFVLGTQRLALDAFEPVDVEMELRVDGALVSSGSGTACLGDPLNALSWLARRAREFGDPLRAGQVVLSGALGPIHPVGPGALVEAELRPLGTVSARFGAGR